MKKLLTKELKLFASPITYFFILFGVMTLVPGYPILIGTFFVCMGIFQSFQNGKDANDILYTVLLPIKKTDAVKAKYIFAVFFEFLSFLIMTACTVLRMTVLSDVEVYVNNVMMPANPFYLAFVLIEFTVFNIVYLGIFFNTAYNTGKPFIIYLIFAFIVVGISEVLHHIPALSAVGAISGDGLYCQYIALAAAFVVFVLGTLCSMKRSMKKFSQIDF